MIIYSKFYNILYARLEFLKKLNEVFIFKLTVKLSMFNCFYLKFHFQLSLWIYAKKKKKKREVYIIVEDPH